MDQARRLKELPSPTGKDRLSGASTLRDGLLNGELFYSMKELRVLAECWRIHYNTARPHSSLGYKPQPFPPTSTESPLPSSASPRSLLLRNQQPVRFAYRLDSRKLRRAAAPPSGDDLKGPQVQGETRSGYERQAAAANCSPSARRTPTEVRWMTSSFPPATMRFPRRVECSNSMPSPSPHP